MRGGDHHAGGKAMRVRKVGNGRCGDHARAGGLNPGVAQPRGQRVGNPCARFARVLPDDHAPRPGRQMIAQRAAHSIDSFLVQRIFAGHAANAVRAKKFSQIAPAL